MFTQINICIQNMKKLHYIIFVNKNIYSKNVKNDFFCVYAS